MDWRNLSVSIHHPSVSVIIHQSVSNGRLSVWYEINADGWFLHPSALCRVMLLIFNIVSWAADGMTEKWTRKTFYRRKWKNVSAYFRRWEYALAGLKVRGRSCESAHSQLGNHTLNSSCTYIREGLKVYTWRAEGILLRGLTYIRGKGIG